MALGGYEVFKECCMEEEREEGHFCRGNSMSTGLKGCVKGMVILQVGCMLGTQVLGKKTETVHVKGVAQCREDVLKTKQKKPKQKRWLLLSFPLFPWSFFLPSFCILPCISL